MKLDDEYFNDKMKEVMASLGEPKGYWGSLIPILKQIAIDQNQADREAVMKCDISLLPNGADAIYRRDALAALDEAAPK
jgi:hypothetical protein